jgi:hypothetical protein
MGELDSELVRVLRPLFAKLLGQIPLIHNHFWLIASLLISVSVVWMLAEKGIKLLQSRTPKPSRRSEFREALFELTHAVVGVLGRARLDLSKGLIFPLIASITALLVAVFGDVPYDFFILLRVLVFITCAIVAVGLFRIGAIAKWFWIVVAIALLYNPLLPIHLHRSTWEWINIVTIPVFATLSILVRPPPADKIAQLPR